MHNINPMRHALSVALLISLFAGNLHATVFTVDTTSDSIADTGSLRYAITNLAAGANIIQFDIPTSDPGYNATTMTWTIQPATDLPNITEQVTINGYTFAGAVYNTNATPNTLSQGDNAKLSIIINGSNYTVGDGEATGNGLHFVASSDNSVVNGLVVNEWLLNGILIDGTAATINGIQINGNFIGTDASGTTALANRCGIGISGATNPITNTVVGTTNVADRNIISGNFGYMILDDYNIRGSGVCSYGNLGTVVQNNYIGTDVSGTLEVGPSQCGVMFMAETDSSILGNIISGHQLFGITFTGITFITYLNPDPGCSGCIIQDNYIGTDVTGKNALANANAGIAIDSYAINTSILNNLISGNGVGIRSGQFNLPGAQGTIIQNNYIGTDVSGALALPNTTWGIIANHSQNTISSNVISGNGKGGLLFYGVNGLYAPGSTNSTMANNYIGTDITGTKVILNGGNGIQLGANGTVFCAADSNTIGS